MLFLIFIIKLVQSNPKDTTNQRSLTNLRKESITPKVKVIGGERGGGTTIKSLSTDQMILQLKPKDREKRGPYL